MKRCLNCDNTYHSQSHTCSSCGFTPDIIEEFESFSPELVSEDIGFKKNYFERLSKFESSNFWFIARNNLICWALKKYFPHFNKFMEVGCGTGYVLRKLVSEFPIATFYGSEIFVSGLHYAKKRVPAVSFFQMDARKIPFYKEFDIVGAFDVIEHIQEDSLVLSQIHQSLKSKGVLILTVPQHTWLWSHVDEHACHVRRYSKTGLYRILEEAGFKIIYSTSFVTFLLPMMLLSRTVKNSKKSHRGAELDIPHWLNYLFLKILNLERTVIQVGFKFPFGGSRLIIAQKL